MTIGLYTFFSETVFKAELDCLFQDLFINWNTVIANYDAQGAGFWWSQVPPSMLPNIFNLESFVRIYSQNLS
jgi:uncharacterized protein YecE (DUF72 family)